MFVHHVVMKGAHGGDVLHQLGRFPEMLANLNAGNGGVDGLIVSARLLGLGIAERLGVESVDLRHSSPQP